MKYTVAMLFFAICFNAEAQFDFSVSDSIYLETKASLFILKNDNGKIPLKSPEEEQWQHFYAKELKNIGAAVDLYFPIESKQLSTSLLKNNKSDQTAKTILSIDLLSESFGKASISALENLIGQENTITLVFDSEQNFKDLELDFSKCSHLIYIRGNTALHQSLAIQLLFGGFDHYQILDEELNATFKKGMGFTSPEKIRLAYAPPEIVGMDSKLLEGIDSIAQSAIDSGAFPGCQVLVVKDEQVVFHKTWGYHTYDKKQKVQRNDIYDFASLTKITSALPALMRLEGEGIINLDYPLKNYFPQFKNSNKADLPIREILAHHAKLKPWIPYWRNTLRKNGKFRWRTFKSKPSKRFPIEVADQLYLHRNYKKRIYKAIKKSPLNAEDGYVYSGLVFYLWPEIVSNLVGEDFETYLKNTFYKPLGASTITYNPMAHFPLERIIPTEKDTFFRKEQIHGKVHDEGAVMMGGVSANAGLFGSANDLAKLMQMYLNGGSYGGKRFISASSIVEFTRCQYCNEGNRRGLGFDKPLIEYHPEKSSVAIDASPASYGHAGYTGTFAWVDPEHQLIYIFFSNRVFPSRENRKIYEFNIRPRIHQVIYDSFLKK